MKTILIILKKEFLQIFRDKIMARMIFAMPVIQLVILANAATFEMKNLKLHIINHDNSVTASALVNKFAGNSYFITTYGTEPQEFAEELLKKGAIDLYLEIPPKFERDFVRESKGGFHLTLNAIDGAKAGLAMYYARSVISGYMAELAEKNALGVFSRQPQINIEYANWFNPELNYTTFMVPGILALLVSMVGLFLSSINLVREKEIGTIEQLNVTPIGKYQLIIGKLTPFWIIGLFELALGLTIGWLLYQVPFIGSVGLLFVAAAVYMTVILGFGLFISTITETQQQAMFITWFISVIFILMSGLFTAIENMPEWAQYITYLNPVRYFMQTVRMVMLKGSGFQDILFNLSALSTYSVIINLLAIANYRKRS